MTELRESHTERIICPSCKKGCDATVDHTWPFYSYVHFCECGYTITESEWEKISAIPNDDFDMCCGGRPHVTESDICGTPAYMAKCGLCGDWVKTKPLYNLMILWNGRQREKVKE